MTYRAEVAVFAGSFVTGGGRAINRAVERKAGDELRNFVGSDHSKRWQENVEFHGDGKDRDPAQPAQGRRFEFSRTRGAEPRLV